MPSFAYSALTSVGQNVSGEVVAEHERAALRELKRRGLTPLSLAVAAAPGRSRLSWRRRAKLEDHIRLVNEFAVMLEAGVSLNEAVEVAGRSRAYQIFDEAIDGLGRDLRRGLSVPDAFRNNITTFPRYVYQLVEAGNETGLLTGALKDASLQMQFDERVRKDLRQALIYPLFLVAIGIAATVFIFLFVVPRFAAMLKDRVNQLPAFSRGIFALGLFVRDNLLVLTLIAGLAIAGLYWLSQRASFRARVQELSVTLPVLGTFLGEAEAGRWAAMLATLLQNRVPLVQSLALARDALHIESFKARLTQVERAVRGGSSLALALTDFRIFDESLINLIRVGERSGRLAEMLKSAAALAEQKGRDRIKRVMTLLEPASILVIGGVIGVIVISLFTAIASINNVPL
ncbi:MAG: type II secretion system F family protein [Alphaproteobacteria bacterium]|nr:type II secretion system F family protein [Alphaproteobacteria bacterium]